MFAYQASTLLHKVRGILVPRHPSGLNILLLANKHPPIENICAPEWSRVTTCSSWITLSEKRSNVSPGTNPTSLRIVSNLSPQYITASTHPNLYLQLPTVPKNRVMIV